MAPDGKGNERYFGAVVELDAAEACTCRYWKSAFFIAVVLEGTAAASLCWEDLALGNVFLTYPTDSSAFRHFSTLGIKCFGVIVHLHRPSCAVTS